LNTLKKRNLRNKGIGGIIAEVTQKDQQTDWLMAIVDDRLLPHTMKGHQLSD